MTKNQFHETKNSVDHFTLTDNGRKTMKTFNRKTLKQTLAPLRIKGSGLEVHFNGGYAYTFNDDRVNIVPCSLEYNGTASFNHLLASLNGKEDEVEVTWKDGEDKYYDRILMIVDGSQKVEIKGHAPNLNVFNLHTDIKLEWYPLPKDFLNCVDTLEKTVSKTPFDLRLSSIHCSPEYFESASEWKICRFYHKLPANFDFLIRGGVLKDILVGAKQIARSQQYCYFKYNTGLVIALRIYNEPYLKTVSKAIEQERTGLEVQLPTELLQSIKKAKLFTDGYQQFLHGTLSDGIFSITANNDLGQYITSEKIDYTGDGVSFEIYARELADVVKFNHKCIFANDCIKIENDRFVFLNSIIPQHEF